MHFLHQYAILFVIEVGIMFAAGWLRPREKAWTFTRNEQVDMTPWPHARPLAITLFSCVVGLYLLFSPIGLAGTMGGLFYLLISMLIIANIGIWVRARSAAPAG